jgi:hypothetical protein
MKKIIIFVSLIGILMGLNISVYSETESKGGSLFYLNVLSGPTDVNCGETFFKLNKDDTGIELKTTLVESEYKNYDVSYAIIEKKTPKTEDTREVYYSYINTGYFMDTNLTQDDFNEIFNEDKSHYSVLNFYKDNLNRYFIKASRKNTEIVEYHSIAFYKNGVGIISSEFPTETGVTDYTLQFVEYANMIRAKTGQSYNDYKNGDTVNANGLKVFLKNFYEVEIKKEIPEKNIASKITNISDKISNNSVNSSMNKVPALEANKEKNLPYVPTLAERRAKNLPLLIFGIVFLVIGLYKGYMSKRKKIKVVEAVKVTRFNNEKLNQLLKDTYEIFLKKETKKVDTDSVEITSDYKEPTIHR